MPLFFDLALPQPEELKELWRQTRVEWLNSRIPASFRYALLDALAERCPWPWGPVAGAAKAMLAQARPAGELNSDGWPDLGSAEHDELTALTLRLILDGPDEDVRKRLVATLGERRYASLIGMLSYLETCRMFVKAHPALAAAAEPPALDARREQLAFEGAPVGMAVVSLKPEGAGVITDVNRAMSVVTGRAADQLVGRSIAEITKPSDVDVDADLLRKLLAGEIPSYEVTKQFRRGDGGWLWGDLSVSLIRDEQSHKPVYLVLQLADITERRRVEEALQVGQERLASVFEEAPNGIGLATLDGRLVEINHALCQTLGYGEAELLNKRLEDLFADDQVGPLKRYLRQLLADEVVGFHVETRVVRPDDELLWVQLSVSLAHDDDGAPAYILVEVQDISERKRLEEELEQGALLDAVTGLPSRALLFDRLEQARSRLERNGSPFAVMFAQADGLDAIGTRFGREHAETALTEVTARLLAAVRSGDTVARYSGDEFVMICEDVESRGEANAIARRAVELGRFSIGDGEAATEIRLTVGLTVAAEADDLPAGLVERADAAMQAAQGRGVELQEYSDSL